MRKLHELRTDRSERQGKPCSLHRVACALLILSSLLALSASAVVSHAQPTLALRGGEMVSASRHTPIACGGSISDGVGV